MKQVATGIGAVLLLLGSTILFGLMLAFPTKWLVNYLFTPATIYSLFGVASLTVCKAFGLNFMCGMLFRSSSKG